MFLNVDFLAGCITGVLIIPPLVRLWDTGRMDGWYRAPRRMPPVGATVLGYLNGRSALITYNGPEGAGDIPEEARLLWRPIPKPWSGR